MLKVCILFLAVLAGCRRPVPTAATPLATVGVAPYDLVSPFLCRITTSELTCMATMEIRFRRGQLETQIARGDQFSFHTPAGKGTAVVWFGCAGVNECGPGYFMFGGNAQLSVVPVEPARYWDNAPPKVVPHGSLGIAEVDVDQGRFMQLRNRWAGTIAPPLVKAGAGLVVTCTELACTVALK